MNDRVVEPQAPMASAAQAALESLHPLMQPEPPAWTPQTVGWQVLMALLCLALGWAVLRGFQGWRARRFRRLALAQLQAVRHDLGVEALRVAAVRRVPELVRQLALAHAPRGQVAALQGEAWWAWLDDSLGDPARPFSAGVGRRLADWAYAPPSALSWSDIGPTLDVLERWMRRHQPPRGER